MNKEKKPEKEKKKDLDLVRDITYADQIPFDFPTPKNNYIPDPPII